MKKYRLLALILALVLAFALTACGGGDTPATNAPSNNTPATDTPDTPDDSNTPADSGEDLGEPVTLKVNNFASESLPFGQGLVAAKEWIEAESNGNITLDLYHDGTVLGFGDTYQGISEGVADIGIVGPAATDAVMTLNSVFTTMHEYLPSDAWDVTTACYELLDAVPELQDEMVNTAGVRWLGMYSLYGSNIHCKGITPTTPDDLKGVGIEALGGVSGYFQLMGANALTLDPGDYYLSMERGVINAQATHWPAMDGYKMSELTDYHLLFGEDGGGIFFGVMGYIINNNVWNNLTAAQQQILWDGFKVGAEKTVELDGPSAEAALNYCTEDGDTFVYLTTEEELAPWIEYINQFNEQWVERVEGAGFPGQATLDKLNELLAKY
jgi:TRAP-type C4-dicarboxylate transport system substrate-binding protein